MFPKWRRILPCHVLPVAIRGPMQMQMHMLYRNPMSLCRTIRLDPCYPSILTILRYTQIVHAIKTLLLSIREHSPVRHF